MNDGAKTDFAFFRPHFGHFGFSFTCSAMVVLTVNFFPQSGHSKS